MISVIQAHKLGIVAYDQTRSGNSSGCRDDCVGDLQPKGGPYLCGRIDDIRRDRSTDDPSMRRSKRVHTAYERLVTHPIGFHKQL